MRGRPSTRSHKSRGGRIHFGACSTGGAPEAVARPPPVQGLRQVVRAGGRRVRPVHVQERPEGEAVRHVRVPRVRRGGGAPEEGRAVADADVRVLERRDVTWAVRLTDLENWGYTR